MNPDMEYDDYSAVDAVEHLISVLQQFFQNQRNKYKFSFAKKHFDTLQEKGTPADSAKLFKILTGTDLVTKKHVLHYRTTSGMRYRIKKEYRQSLQRDIRTQLLLNKNFIPKTFTMAQNCLLGYASSMDGFGALKAMLKLTHPLLSRKRPTNVPPIMSDFTDIHAYEQGLRNFYLLHKLYNDTNYPPIEKARQFLQGIDDDRYTDAVARIQHQLDTVETLNVSLHEDYDIDNIASTILNITGEYDNNKTVINTMRSSSQGHRNYSNTNKPSRPSHRSQDQPTFYPRKNDAQRKFAKIQCHGCKQFGHAITHCTLLPKILAIIQFQRRNKDKCTQILKHHIHNNTINSKRTFVRALMNMHALPLSDDSDAYLQDDVIVNAVMDNDISDDDFNSQSE